MLQQQKSIRSKSLVLSEWTDKNSLGILLCDCVEDNFILEKSLALVQGDKTAIEAVERLGHALEEE